MSYLSPLRLHFAGQFQASISTVNNVSGNFNNATFNAADLAMDSKFGGFNPPGDAAWRLVGCRVTSATRPGGIAANDPVLGFLVADADSRVPAKLVDLDSEQQLVSTIWGLQLRLTDSSGTALLTGTMDPAAFMDIWKRSQGGGDDNSAGAMFQSVLTDLQWADVSCSKFLTDLKATATAGLLSLKFNVDSIDLDYTSPEFMRGRLVGTLGPASASEPRYFVPGRQLAAVNNDPLGFIVPAAQVNWCVARVDEHLGKVFLDLGNALPTSGGNGALVNLGDLTLRAGRVGGTANEVILGTIPAAIYFNDPNWYGRTGGVIEFPSDRSLTSAELQTVLTSPLSLTGTDPQGKPVGVTEDPSGRFVRADKFVFRLNPNPGEPDHQVQVKLFATEFGRPLANTVVNVAAYLDQLQPQGKIYYDEGDPINVGTPTTAIDYPATTAPTDAEGVATLTITGQNPGNPRGFLDGQLYGLALSLPGQPPTPANTFQFISLLVWDAFVPDNPITWHGSIQPIFQQYANLYPVMKRFLDLGNYEQVKDNAKLLALAFGLPIENPNSMPVTRDLSWAKRQAILEWLNGSATQPKLALGSPPVATTALGGPAMVAAARPPGPKGGKLSAMTRRLAFVRRSAQS